LPLHFLTFFIVVEHDLAIAKVATFYAALCFPKEGSIARKSTTGPRIVTPLFERFGFPGAISGQQDFIVECEKLAEGARIPLPPATTNKLAVDSLGFVEFTANHMQSTNLLYFISQANVGATPCHIGCHSDPATLACRGDNFCFLVNLTGVQDLVFDSMGGEELIGYQSERAGLFHIGQQYRR
jgi:hypothetical protein